MPSTLMIIQAYKNGKLKIIMITNRALNFTFNENNNEWKY
jgi:hypothetical protein